MQTNQSPKSDNGLSKGQNAAALEMSIFYIISVFARELPGYFIFGWIFMPVTLLLLLLIAYFRIQLSKEKIPLTVQCPKEGNSHKCPEWDS
uniref:Small leucine-rich protein 1 n=1 Tax=Pavo cristatus TaxID=9049 RepID=A0A8C9FRY1_PAVCR